MQYEHTIWNQSMYTFNWQKVESNLFTITLTFCLCYSVCLPEEGIHLEQGPTTMSTTDYVVYCLKISLLVIHLVYL